MNNPVNRFDEDGNWSMPNWAKVAVVAYLGVGVEASCGFNLTYFVNELIEIFLE